MSLVDSLLGAIVKLDGDSLVLHTGEKPYVVTSSSAMNAFRGPLAWGQVELSTKTLTVAAVMSMLDQLLTDEQRHVLEDMGAVEHYLPATDDRPAFHVVVARGGEDIWVEIRPVRPTAVPEPAAEPLPEAVASPQPTEGMSGEALPEVPQGPSLEVVPDIEQEQPDAAAVAALLASAGLARAGGSTASASDDTGGRKTSPEVAARLEQEETRLAAAGEEATRLEASVREEGVRLEALREEASRLEASREEAGRAATAAREEATRIEAEARAAAEALELAAREEAARLQALREEAVALEQERETAARSESARIDALRAEAAQVEAVVREEAARISALREETARLEAAREEAARLEAAARDEAARVQALREEAARLEAAREEAARLEAAARDEAARVQALREEAARLDAAREEAARVETAARDEAVHVQALREEAVRLEAARDEAARLEAAARDEAVHVQALRVEAARLEAAREEAARLEAAARDEAARVGALRLEAEQLEAARAEAARVEAAAREEATRIAEALRAQNTALESARQEMVELRETVRIEAERLEAARSTVAEAEQRHAEAERQEQERIEALRDAQRLEHGRLEELRAEAVRLETLRRDEAALLEAARAEAQALDLARRDGEERLQAVLVDVSSADASPAVAAAAVPAQPGEALPARAQETRPVTAVPDQAAVPAEPPQDVHAGDARPAHVLPLVRGLREQPPAVSTPGGPAAPDLDRLLRIAAARGASGLYLVNRSHPAVRVDGDMQPLDGEEPLAAADVEAFMLALVPEPSRDSVKSGATVEWFCEVPEIGRVRCLSFRDHRGPGVIIRMLPARAISAEQLGLSKDIQALCAQPDGLVLIAGPRASGKSTTLAAFVDLINRTRADHVITIERQVTFVHESQRAFVSQREVRGEAHEVLAAVRAALREDPDVLVVEELRSPEVVAAALESAESGRLVLAGLRAPASAHAVERLMDQVPADRRPQALSALSTSLRGVISQVLLRRRAGGRVAARELLLNTPAAAAVLAEGKLFQLGAALESGRKLGSLPLNDSLAALIRDGIVDPGEAWRKAYDREGLVTLLKREGIDTSFVERLA